MIMNNCSYEEMMKETKYKKLTLMKYKMIFNRNPKAWKQK